MSNIKQRLQALEGSTPRPADAESQALLAEWDRLLHPPALKKHGAWFSHERFLHDNGDGTYQDDRATWYRNCPQRRYRDDQIVRLDGGYILLPRNNVGHYSKDIPVTPPYRLGVTADDLIQAARTGDLDVYADTRLTADEISEGWIVP